MSSNPTSPIRALILDAGQVMTHSGLRDQWNIPPRAREIIGDRADVIGTLEWCAACNRNLLRVREDILLTDIEGEYAMRRDFVEAVAREIHQTLTPDEISALARDLTVNPDRYIWYDDVLPALRTLKARGIKLGVLSDAMPSLGVFLGGFDREGLLDAVVLSTQVGATKPSPRMYEAILARLDLPAESCLFVDDRACNLRGAERAGLHCAQMLRYPGDTPDYTPAVRGMAEVVAMITG